MVVRKSDIRQLALCDKKIAEFKLIILFSYLFHLLIVFFLMFSFPASGKGVCRVRKVLNRLARKRREKKSKARSVVIRKTTESDGEGIPVSLKTNWKGVCRERL